MRMEGSFFNDIKHNIENDKVVENKVELNIDTNSSKEDVMTAIEENKDSKENLKEIKGIIVEKMKEFNKSIKFYMKMLSIITMLSIPSFAEDNKGETKEADSKSKTESMKIKEEIKKSILSLEGKKKTFFYFKHPEVKNSVVDSLYDEVNNELKNTILTKEEIEVIKSDMKIDLEFFNITKESYYKKYPIMKSEKIDSIYNEVKSEMIEEAIKENKKETDEKKAYEDSVARGEIEMDLTSENHPSGLSSAERNVMNIFFPEETKLDPGFREKSISPSENTVNMYKKGLFKTKEEYLKIIEKDEQLLNDSLNQ